MESITLAEFETAATAAAQAAEDAGGTDESLNTAAETAKQAFETAKALPQDFVKTELERVRRKEPKTEAEKAAFALKKNAERAKELGLDPAAILGVVAPVIAEDDNAPVTIGMLRKLDAEKSQKTALEMANEITNENERELTKVYLQTRIVPSGNPQEDLKMARALVNSVKNGQIAEEINRRGNPSIHGGGGAPIRHDDPAGFTPTDEESKMMRPPFSLSKEKILEVRKAQAQQ